MNLWPERVDADCTVRTAMDFHQSFRIKYMYSTALVEPALDEVVSEALYDYRSRQLSMRLGEHCRLWNSI